MEIVKINTDYITLTQFLKMVNLISSGGEAKFYLANNKVLVNNELESRRGRKLYDSYKILISNKAYVISHD